MIHQQLIDIIDAELAEKSFEQLAQKANVSHPWPRALRRKLPHSIAKLESFVASLGYRLIIVPIASDVAEAEPETAGE
jgi:hypothetical protein